MYIESRAARALIVSLALGWAAHAAGASDSAAEKVAATTCASCHGQGGRSTSAPFPNLAAQTAPYLELQLKAFREQTRADPDAQAYMWGMAAQLDDATIQGLAAYYASQRPAPGASGEAKSVAQGKLVFEQGVAASQIPACASCHGAHAQGVSIFPRLAGQHAAYLVKQMLVIQSALRNAPVMHGVIKELTREQMQSVADYLQSLD